MAAHLEHAERPVAFVGAWAGGGALLADGPDRVAGEGDDPFALLDDVGEGTWAGWLGHGLAWRLEALPPPPSSPVPRPPFVLARYRHVCRLDGDGRWWVEAPDEPDPSVVARWQARLDHAVPAPPGSLGEATATPDRDAHLAAVEEAQLRIGAGRLYQANVCLRLDAPLAGSALGLWLDRGRALRSPRAAFVGWPGGAVASLSPEVFLLRHGREATSQPIQGTRPRTDAGLAELLAAEKDRAEHVMIVDLVRHDLGRVCEAGSVRVPSLLAAEPLAGVWHLVSTVTGRLRGGVGDGDLVRACFPPGSVTGAPKVAAVAACAELEATAREAYCGAVGFASADHGLELNVAIRTFEVAGDRCWLGVGGGVVAASEPLGEWEECRAKAAPLVTWPTPDPPPPAPAPVFDTVLVVDGHVAELAAHADRFRAATGFDATELLRAEAAGLGPGTFRLRVDEGGTTTASPCPRPPVLDGAWHEVEATPVQLPGGWGGRKRSDRAHLEALERSTSPAVPLLCDGDDVLEGTRTAVLAVVGGVVRAPTLDGRVLPSVTRRALLDVAVDLGVPVRLGRLPLDELLAADAVVLVGAIGGLSWCRRVGSRAWAAADPLVARLAAGLSARWSPARAGVAPAAPAAPRPS